MKKIQLYLGAGLVILVVAVALISLVWTPYDPVSYTHLTLPTICSV